MPFIHSISTYVLVASTVITLLTFLPLNTAAKKENGEDALSSLLRKLPFQQQQQQFLSRETQDSPSLASVVAHTQQKLHSGSVPEETSHDGENSALAEEEIVESADSSQHINFSSSAGPAAKLQVAASKKAGEREADRPSSPLSTRTLRGGRLTTMRTNNGSEHRHSHRGNGASLRLLQQSPGGGGSAGSPAFITEKDIFKSFPWGVPFPFKVKTFNPQVLEGYSSCSYLLLDIIEALKYFADSIILEYSDEIYFNKGQEDDTSTNDDSSFQPGPMAPPWGVPQSGEDSFKTNVQREGIDEPDIAKSDGEFVYAAYGDILVAWNAKTGKKLSTIKISPSDSIFPIDIGENLNLQPEEDASPPYYYYSWRKPRIESLLLDADSHRLVVIARKYYKENDYRNNRPYKIFSDDSYTQIRLYDTSLVETEGTLNLVASKNIPGSYEDARSIGADAHIVIMSFVNTRGNLEEHLARWHDEYVNMNATEYVGAAKKVAEKIIPTFGYMLMNEVAMHNDCSRIVQVNTFTSPGQEDILPSLYSYSSIINRFAQVVSFDMSASPNSWKDLSIKSKAGYFLKYPLSEVYASKSLLFLASRGYSYDPLSFSHKQSTYLLGFHLQSDGSARPAAGAQVRGFLLNQFSMDDHNGFLRVATTNQEQWGLVDGEWQLVSDSSNQIQILRLPELNDDKVAIMDEVGILKGLGDPGEEIFSVRFIGNIGFVVTFRQTDPFYTVDLTDPTKPIVVGELKISGFSNYLHSINDDNTLILAVGQEALPATGQPIGLQISLFDVTDLKNPVLAARYHVETRSSSSEVQYNHMAFRYLPVSKLLILPVSIQANWQDVFDGFIVYDVSKEKIEPRFNISHVDPYALSVDYCWYSARLAPRSFVFSGDVTTLKGHSVQSHNMQTGAQLWNITLDEHLDFEDCHYYWY